MDNDATKCAKAITPFQKVWTLKLDKKSNCLSSVGPTNVEKMRRFKDMSYIGKFIKIMSEW